MQAMRASSMWAWGVGALLLLSLPAISQAQEQSQSTAANNFVILDVPGGGTKHLAREFHRIGAFTLRNKKWFVGEIRKSEIDPGGLMQRPADLKRLMEGADIAYILYLRPNSSNSKYRVRAIHDETGEPAFETTIARPNGGGLTPSAAESVRIEFESFLERRGGKSRSNASASAAPSSSRGASPSTARSASSPTPSSSNASSSNRTASSQKASSEPNSIRAVSRRARKRRQRRMRAGQTDWLWVASRFRLFRRDLTIGGVNDSVLNYDSTYYPGFQIDAEAYPLSPVEPRSASVGLIVEYTQGFEQVLVPRDDGTNRQVSLSHTEFEIGPSYRLGEILKDGDGGIRTRVRVKATVRYSSFSVTPNEELPSTSLTAFTFGGIVTQPVFVDGLAAEGRLELIPFALFGRNEALFGETSSTSGFMSRLGLLYGITSSVRAMAGYRFRLHHSRFQGEGTERFVDSEGYELVQGVDLGIQYNY